MAYRILTKRFLRNLDEDIRLFAEYIPLDCECRDSLLNSLEEVKERVLELAKFLQDVAEDVNFYMDRDMIINLKNIEGGHILNPTGVNYEDSNTFISTLILAIAYVKSKDVPIGVEEDMISLGISQYSVLYWDILKAIKSMSKE